MSNRYDLVIRGGTVADGTGGPTYEADVAIAEGTIASLGKVSGSGLIEINPWNWCCRGPQLIAGTCRKHWF